MKIKRSPASVALAAFAVLIVRRPSADPAWDAGVARSPCRQARNSAGSVDGSGASWACASGRQAAVSSRAARQARWMRERMMGAGLCAARDCHPRLPAPAPPPWIATACGRAMTGFI